MLQRLKRTIKHLFFPMAVLFIATSFTGAYFSDSVSVSGNSFETGSWGGGSPPPAPTPARVVINEVYYNPDTEHGGANAEWIEIYNAGGTAIDIKNWYFKNSSTGTETISQTYVLDHGQFAVVTANASTITEWGIIPNNAHKIALGGSKLFNGLVNGGDRLRLFDNNNNEIDALSWGSDTSVFDPSKALAVQGSSISRSPNGLDTDSASDFIDLSAPTPGS